MSNKTYNFQITAKNTDNQIQPGLKLEVWLILPGDDRLLATEITDEKGVCQLTLSIKPNEVKGMPPTVYVLAYRGNELIYDRRRHPTYKLIRPSKRATIKIKPRAFVPSVYSGVFSVLQLNTLTPESDQWTAQQVRFITEKLNQMLVAEIRTTIANVNNQLAESLNELSLDYRECRDATLGELIQQTVWPILEANPKLGEILAEQDWFALLSGLERTLVEVLQLNRPLKEHPAFSQDIRQFKVEAIAGIATGDPAIAIKLTEQAFLWENASDQEWEKLVDAGTITKAQKTKLQHSFNLGKMTGSNLSLVHQLVQDTRITTTKDLVAWKKEDWQDILDRSNKETPKGETPEKYIENVMRVVEASYPTDFFITRLVVEKGVVEAEVNFSKALYKNNPTLFSQKEINWDGIEEDQREEVESSYKQLKKVANQYKYLGVPEILNSSKTPKQKENAVTEALQSIATFYKNNPELDLLYTNLIKKPTNEESTLNWEGITEDMQPKVQRQMLAFQRVRSIASDHATSSVLLENNYDSAYKIAYKGKAGFMTETKIPEAQAKRIYANAQKKAAQAVQQYHSIVELHHNQQLGLAVDNTIAHTPTGYQLGGDITKDGDSTAANISLYDQVRNELKDIDGFEALFGPQNFCQCDHCKSIFSPAAYFVDMMHFVEQHITEYSALGNIPTAIDPVFPEDEGPATHHPANKNSNHPLWLQNRRPDLWDIELTCECTYEMVPYLQIINEIKETYIKKLWTVDGVPANQLEDVYESIRTESDNWITFYATASKAYQEVLILLEYFDVSLLDLVKVRQGDIVLQTQAYLGMHTIDFNISANPFKLFGNKSAFNNIEVREFLKHAKITRQELSDLLATNYISSRSNIKIVKSTFDEGIQYWHEQMIDIDQKGLSYIHHFIRLWKKLPWTIKELDLVFDTTNVFNNANNGNTPYSQIHLLNLYRLAQIQNHLDIGLEEVIGIVHQIPNKSLRTVERKDPLTQELFEENIPGYLDRHFNLEKIFTPSGGIDIDPSDSTDQEAFSFFLSSLKIKEEDFNEMLSWGNTNLVAPIAGSSGVAVFSEYFRHIQLARRLKVSLKEWSQILQLTQAELDRPHKILSLIEWVKSQKDNPFSYEELLLLTANSNNQSLVTNEEIIDLLHIEEYPVFTRSIFEAIDANPARVDNLINTLVSDQLISELEEAGNYQLTTKFDWTQLDNSIASLMWINASVALKEALTPYHYLKHLSSIYVSLESLANQTELNQDDSIILLDELATANVIIATPDKKHFRVLDTYNAAALQGIIDSWTAIVEPTPVEEATTSNLTNAKDAIHAFLLEGKAAISHQYFTLWESFTGLESQVAEAIIPFMNNDWLSGFYTLFGTENEASDPIPVNFWPFAEEMKLKALLFEKLGFNASNITFLAQNANSVFKIINIQSLELEDITALVEYQEWQSLDESAVEGILHPMLLNIKTDLSKVDTIEAFKHYFDLPENITADVFIPFGNGFNIPAGSNAVQFANYLKTRALLCQKLGVRNQQLGLIASSSYDIKQTFANTLYATIKGEFENIEDYEKAIEPYEEKLNEIKRDILCDYIMARDEVNFKDANELYAYFLLDPQMSGCMKISKIVAGHLTLQLYIHRTLMNLEQSIDDQFKAFLEPEVHQEWEWRKNYRVWEANRKVGVYPENFIEPEWRDNKSPEFKQLEEELLQQKITIESAEGAYKEYLKKFELVGDLIIAGTYFYSEEGVSKYYIFGRSQDDPYQYYYRIFNSIAEDWGPWEKIDVAISAPYLSAIIYNGKVFIFWIDVHSNRKHGFNNGNSVYTETDFKITLNYSSLSPNKQWKQPQSVQFAFLHWSGNDFNYESYYPVNKTLRKVYPYIRDGKLYILYGIKNGNANTIFRRLYGELDLYANNVIQRSRNQTLINQDIIRVVNWQKAKLILFEESEYIGQPAFSLTTEVDRDYHLVSFMSEQPQFESEYLNYRTLTSDFEAYTNYELNIVHSKSDEYTFSFRGQQFLIGKESGSTSRKMKRLTTTLPKKIAPVIAQGLDVFLSLPTQYTPESELDLDFVFPSELVYKSDNPIHVDFKGPNSLYFRELFFQIPFLIADHLNAEGKYQDADWWYRKIFDPTAAEDDYMTTPIDRNWQYIEFRDQDFPKYSEMLSDPAFIDTYRKDPFNPHAIARLRTSAYQKAIVLKYIDNLLDWGDSLFRKFQFESINEAMMLYILAQDILGERPQELCKCETGADDKLTYKDIHDALEAGNEFLIWMENQQQVITQIGMTNPGIPVGNGNPGGGDDNNTTATYANAKLNVSYDDTVGEQKAIQTFEDAPGYTYTTQDGRVMYVQNVTTQKPVFCVPMNKEILGLWERVEDRLFKIRHCMNIDGIKQTLALFPPPIDPRLLVAARASGLSIADAIASLDAPVPNYRFNYMLEKAKSFAGTVQSFGGTLLSALEKKDAEELTLLRSVHEQNILKMTKEIKKQQIEENKVQIKNLEETKKNIEFRRDHYAELIETGLIAWERTQQIATHTSSILYGVESIFNTMSAISYLIPNVGAPTAMTYGGKEIGSNMQAVALATNSAAKTASLLASSAGLEGGNQRREEEWEFQRDTAENELIPINQQIIAAQIRLAIAEKDLEIHNKQVEQTKELYDFYKEKFTNLGLYKYMATTMNRLFSQAYNLAFDMAKKAEKCYQFETDDISFFIENGNWDAGHAGLLAGEQLSLQLMRMEKAFIEKSPRREEIRQSFSLRMLNPLAFLALRKDGSCTFSIPEEALDIYYPGHYKRMIKSASITIPCVVGPYTNVPVRFTLLSSEIRNEAEGDLFQGPNFANGGLSASSAVNDSGQLELNFQDAKYLPFEGGGAISTWSLQLPDSVRPFDYNSISDVILQISYTAAYDVTLRTQVEQNIATKIPGTFARLVSVREEFPDIWYRLEQGESNVPLELTPNLLPFFMANNGIETVEYIKIESGDTIATADIGYTGAPIELSNTHIVNLPTDSGTVWNDVILIIHAKQPTS